MFVTIAVAPAAPMAALFRKPRRPTDGFFEFSGLLMTGSSDGWFRAVISERDPGVPNWLDKADYPWGVIQMRWNRASEYPDPTIKKVPVADVRAHLPADTPVVTPEERAESLRRRREGAQLRRIW